jgi:uncharacterized protein (DUF983 family)
MAEEKSPSKTDVEQLNSDELEEVAGGKITEFEPLGEIVVDGVAIVCPECGNNTFEFYKGIFKDMYRCTKCHWRRHTKEQMIADAAHMSAGEF